MTASKELLKRTYITQFSALSGIEDKKKMWMYSGNTQAG